MIINHSLPVAVESIKASAEPAWQISGFFAQMVSLRNSSLLRNPQPVLFRQPVPGFNDMTFFEGFFLVGVPGKNLFTRFVGILCGIFFFLANPVDRG